VFVHERKAARVTTDASSPLLLRWELAQMLRELRLARGMSASEVAVRLGWAPSKLSRIENREGGISPGDVRELLDVYGISDPEDVRRWVDMAREARLRGWWQHGDFGAHLPSFFVNFLGLEAGASAEYDYRGGLVTGLLQTADYARAVLGSGAPGTLTDEGELDRRVEIRLQRQHILHRGKEPLRLWALLDEGVLRRRIGGPQVLREQLQHVLELSELDNVTVQILPDAEVHPALDFPFSILHFGDELPISGIVYLENFHRSVYLDDRGSLNHYQTAFDQLAKRALDPQASRTLIHQHAKALDIV
jgi:transcriptional regulator with XRE-family HTH domain